MKVGFISLGCSKNLIDTEMAIGVFKKGAFEIVAKPEEAEIIVINTCGFIESAKEEAISTIFEMLEFKQKGKCKYLIVMGCLVERYIEDLKRDLSEVDLFIPIKEYNAFWEKIDNLINISKEKNSENYCLDYHNRVVTTGEKTAYLKIAEGCSNRCTYCAIPYIRGAYISREKEDILKEARELAKKGFKEIIVIAQDTTKYGIDLYGKSMLAELLEELCKIEEFKWIRFLYSYPESITDELIEVVKNNEKICKYFDIPLQHISNKILKTMNRFHKGNGTTDNPNEYIKKLIKKIRKEIPNVILRTSLIVGFPGEDKNDFESLYNFVEETKFERLGVFTYSKEDGTPAAKLKNQIHPSTKKSRHNKIMKLCKNIYEEKQNSNIGKEYEVLVEAKSFDGKYYIGRSYMDIPDMDGVIYIENVEKNIIGEFVNCIITDVEGYDLIGTIKKVK